MGRHKSKFGGWVGETASKQFDKDWKCGKCGFENWGWRWKCLNCAGSGCGGGGQGNSGRRSESQGSSDSKKSQARATIEEEVERAVLAKLAASGKPDLVEQAREFLQHVTPAETRGSGKLSTQLSKATQKLTRHRAGLKTLEDALEELEAKSRLTLESIAKQKESIAAKKETIAEMENQQTELRVSAEQGEAASGFCLAFPHLDKQAMATAPGLRLAETYATLARDVAKLKSSLEDTARSQASSEVTSAAVDTPGSQDLGTADAGEVDVDFDDLELDDDVMQQVAGSLSTSIGKADVTKLGSILLKSMANKHGGKMVLSSIGKRKAPAGDDQHNK